MSEAKQSLRDIHMNEFLEKEQNYVEKLRSLFGEIVNPMLDAGVSPSKLDEMFGQHKILLGKHQLFYTKFFRAAKGGESSLGQILMDHFRDLRLFSDVINREEEIRKDFDMLQAKGHKVSTDQGRIFKQTILGTMQIVTRYPLLMKDIIKASRKEGASDILALEAAKGVLDETVDTLNELKRGYDNRKRIREIQRKMPFVDLLPVVRQGRLFCREGYVFSKWTSYIFALKGTSLRKFINEDAYNRNEFVEEHSVQSSSVDHRIEGGNRYSCKIIITTTNPTNKLQLFTNDTIEMSNWVESLKKVGDLRIESLASDYRVLLQETDMLYMKKQDKAVFSRYHLFLFNDCIIIAAEGSAMPGDRKEILGVNRQGSFRMRRKPSSRGHRDTIGDTVARRRNQTAPQRAAAKTVAGDEFQHIETLFFFSDMEISQSKFNAEYLIHIRYKFSDDLEQEYVLAFRDGSMHERAQKWEQWYNYLTNAHEKFMNMIKLSKSPQEVSNYCRKIDRISHKKAGNVSNLEKLEELLQQTLEQLEPSLLHAEKAVKKDVDDTILLMDSMDQVDSESAEYEELSRQLRARQEAMNKIFKNQLTQTMKDVTNIRQKLAEVSHIRGGTIFKLL